MVVVQGAKYSVNCTEIIAKELKYQSENSIYKAQRSFPEEMSMFVNILCAIQRYNAQQNMEFNVENLTLSQGEQTM